jgi:hypothetical protein
MYRLIPDEIAGLLDSECLGKMEEVYQFPPKTLPIWTLHDLNDHFFETCRLALEALFPSVEGSG